MPRFSVVVPAYNAAPTLSETLDAVLGQEFEDWECVIVDDGSADDTLAIASTFASRDSRIAVHSQPNAGTAGAYNTGVSNARGEFVIVCSSDDILLPVHMREMDALIRREGDFDIYSCNGYYWRPEEQSRQLVYREGEIKDSLTLADVIKNCFFGVGATYRREIFHRVGGYRTEVFGEDYDFWMRTMAMGARHRYLDTPLSLHRIAATQKTADLDRVYSSDIRLVTDLARDFDLTEDELEAVAETVRRRELLIERLRESRVKRMLRENVASRPWLRPVRALAAAVSGLRSSAVRRSS